MKNTIDVPEDEINVRAHVKGAWIKYNAPFTDTLCCSVCGFNVLPELGDYNFCPNCGAYMRGEKDET